MKASNRQRVHDWLVREGVTLIDPHATYINERVRIGPDTTIYPGVVLCRRFCPGPPGQQRRPSGGDAAEVAADSSGSNSMLDEIVLTASLV